MAKNQAVWALDIGQSALKALKLVPGETPEQVVAEAFDYVEYPKILSQPDADAEELVREALATFLERNDLKGSKVAIGVPGQAGLVKFIKLPPVEKKRIPDIVKFEAKQQIPFALEEVIWAYQQIGNDDDDDDSGLSMAEVGLFAMKKDQINRAILPFKNAGIEVDVVQMGPIALYNYANFDQLQGAEAPGSVVLIDIGADNTDLIISDGVRIWQRNVPIGGNHFTRALTKELKLTFAKAEHLKRNATKAPDPRAVFTAMRGIFNDFASEVNRSIGFYSSVNRSAKIAKVIGLGNGFKLPGLQKFLQQNLTHEVEKLETFPHLEGDEVKSAPQFQENLASFAVAYGLGLQALGKSQIRTNLLPPEIEQVRMIRRKKPWALAASTLLMVGLSGLFLSEWKALAKVSTPEFKTAREQAENATKTGKDFKAGFEAAKGEWEAKNAEGEALIIDSSERASWPQFLQIINAYLPNPAKELKAKDPNFDPKDPRNAGKISELHVHIDAIKPVWRTDVAAEWFTDPALVEDKFKYYMHPLDRDTPPAGAGWIIQLVGHHYNPVSTAKDRELPANQQYHYGPVTYLSQIVLPRLYQPALRRFGIHHVYLSKIYRDPEWTTGKAQNTGTVAMAEGSLMKRATPPVGAEGGDDSMMSSMMAMMGGGGGGMGDASGGSGGMDSSMMAGMQMQMGMGMRNQGGRPGSDPTKKMTMLTRTDFIIQFVWQPPTAENPPQPIADIVKAMTDAAKLKGSIKPPTEAELNNASLASSKKAIEGYLTARKATAKAAAPAEAPAADGDAPAPAPATPAAPPAAQ